jgi:tight adherence protein B
MPMIQGTFFYLFLFLMFAGVGWFLYHALCDENGEFLGDYARWLVTQSEAIFQALGRGEAKARIAGWTLGPALLLGLMHPLLGLVGALLGWHVPRLLMRRQIQKRHAAFEAQLVDALVLLSNALRSGLSLLQGFRIIVKEMPPPISQEFELVLREQQISAALDDALLNLGQRIRSKDLDIVITSILTLRETGGNLPETFDTVTYTIRERKKVEGKVDALTTMGVTQGVVACFLPYAFLGLMGIVQPQLIRPLLTTWPGWICIGLATVLDVLGYFFIRRMARVQV